MGVIDFFNVTCFEASSNNGYLNVQVSSTSKLTAEFQVSYSCSEFIQPISASIVYLKAFETRIQKTPIFTTIVSTNKNHTCLAQLKNSVGDLLDQKSFNFSTYKTVIQTPQTSGNNETTNQTQQTDNITDQCQTCSNFFSILCIIKNVTFTIRTARSQF